MSKPCSMARYGCKYTVGDNSEHAECYLCRTRAKFWRDKEPADRMARNDQLQKWQARLELAGGTRVVRMRIKTHKKAKTHLKAVA